MAIFTPISLNEANQIIRHYQISLVQKIEPITEGTVNSNFYLSEKQKKYILTIFETLSKQQVAAILKITHQLSQDGLPCPSPFQTITGEYMIDFKQKPTALITYLPGIHPTQANPSQCEIIGEFLAKLHTHHEQPNFPTISNTMGSAWRRITYDKLCLTKQLKVSQKTLLQQIIQKISTLPEYDVPRGFIHADLFKDNTLFQNEQLSGVIDFYFGCTDMFSYDVAIAINDWCFQGNQWLPHNYNALLNAYQAIRPFTPLEKQHWQSILLVAALRFWLSRLKSLYFPKEAVSTTLKDPVVFEQRIQHHLSTKPAI